MTSKIKPNLYDSMTAFNGEKKAKDFFRQMCKLYKHDEKGGMYDETRVLCQ